MGKVPYMPLYGGDWRRDPALSKCDPATRGIWMDLLLAMYDDNQSGEVIGTCEQLARIARCSPSQMETAIADLEQTGTATIERIPNQFRSDSESIPTQFRLINRRMKRECNERAATAERVARYRERDAERKRNGNVTPEKQKSNTPSSYSYSNTKEKDKEKEPRETRSSAIADVFEFWKSETGHTGAKLTPDRRRKIEARISEGYDAETIKQAIRGCLSLPFNRGENSAGRVYDDLELICRSGSKVEQYAAVVKGKSGNGKSPPAEPYVSEREKYDRSLLADGLIDQDEYDRRQQAAKPRFRDSVQL